MYQELSCPPRQPLSSRVFLGWGFSFEFLWLTLCKIHFLYWHHGKPMALLSFITLQRPRPTSLMQRLELSKLLIPTPAHTPLTEDLLGSQYLFIHCAVGYRGSSWKVFHYLRHYQRPNFFLDLNNSDSTLSECLKLRVLPPPWLWQCASLSPFSCLCNSHCWWSWRPRLA